MALNANALTTLSRIKTELDIPSGNSDFDTRLEYYINACSNWIEEVSNRIFRSQAYTHRFDGNNKKEILVEQFPITAITEVNVDDAWTFAAGTALGAGETTIVDDIWIARRCGLFRIENPQNVQIQYTAGFATTPPDIEQACIEWVRHLWSVQKSRRSSINSKSKLGESVTYFESIPDIIRVMIEPHKRDNVIKKKLSLRGVFVNDDSGSKN